MSVFDKKHFLPYLSRNNIFQFLFHITYEELFLFVTYKLQAELNGHKKKPCLHPKE